MSTTKYRLSDTDIRSLTTLKAPEMHGGKVRVMTRPEADQGKPYRFGDATPGAPTGFGIYVGKTGSSYTVERRIRGKFIRITLGSVNDMSLKDAHELARKKMALAMELGENPKRHEAIEEDRVDVRSITVEECMTRYIAHLQLKVDRGVTKAVSLVAVQNSLSRLSRPEVNLAKRQVRDLDQKLVIKAWNNLKKSAMKMSNLLPARIKDLIIDRDDWHSLTPEQFRQLGITGKYVQRVKSAGVSATEQTFGDLSRSINLVMKEERRNASRQDRQPELTYNPIEFLSDEGFYRSRTQFNDHARKAQIRNPLGEADQTLPRVLKTLIARRHEQGGNNRVGVDYLMLTLLFGSRRNEAAQLVWYDKCQPDELEQENVSWVWLASNPDQINPTTKRKGSQAFFHDMKGKDVRFLPVGYFAERILLNRLRERNDEIRELPGRIETAKAEYEKLLKATGDARLIGNGFNKFRSVERRLENMRFVFPARSSKAKEGHYSDSKSILRNVRRDAGMVDLSKDIDIGLTPHDLRRTLGRFAERKFGSGRLTSQLLHHKLKSEGAAVTDLYNEQEWSELRNAMAAVEEDMIATSPRVWNLLKGPEKERLDEVRDDPVELVDQQ